MKRNDYDDEIEFYCEDCGDEFVIAGYIVDTPDGPMVWPATGSTIECPTDYGHDISLCAA